MKEGLMDPDLLSIKEMRDDNIYFAYTDMFEPIYYVTKDNEFLCAYCATKHSTECKNPKSNYFLTHVRIRKSNMKHELKCSCCEIKIESTEELEYAMKMAEMIEYTVKGMW
jgi:hypothetical protein